VEKFLGIDHEITRDNFVYNRERGFFCYRSSHDDTNDFLDDVENCLSEGKGRPHPTIDPMVLQKMVDFFKPFNEKFFDLVGRRFNWRHFDS
jgi:hypothetical protein